VQIRVAGSAPQLANGFRLITIRVQGADSRRWPEGGFGLKQRLA